MVVDCNFICTKNVVNNTFYLIPANKNNIFYLMAANKMQQQAYNSNGMDLMLVGAGDQTTEFI